MTPQHPRSGLWMREQIALEIGLPTVGTMEVFSALTEPYRPHPEFQVLRAVIATDAVDMVHRLALSEGSAQGAGHHHAVLSGDLSIFASHKCIALSVRDSIWSLLPLLGVHDVTCPTTMGAPTTGADSRHPLASIKRNLTYLDSSAFPTQQHTLILSQNGFSCKITALC